MIVENDENDDEPDIEELGSALHGRRRRGRAVLLFGRAERVSQVVRRASKCEKFDTPGLYIHASAVGVVIGELVLAEDGRSIQAIHVGLDTNAPAAVPIHRNATTAMRADDQRVPGHARVSSCHAPAGRVVGANFDLIDVEAVPGDRVDAVLEDLPLKIPVRRLCCRIITFYAETTLGSTLLPGQVGPEVPTADDALVGQDQGSIAPRGKFHVLVLVTERLAENIEQD